MPRGTTRGALLAAAFMTAGIAVAGPAAAAPALAPDIAVPDPAAPTPPTATVERGPSCSPGGVVVRVVGGSVPWSVVLATTRHPEGEDRAEVAPGGTVVLHSAGVSWGETIDSRLVYTALDGSGAHAVDELTDWTFTRPTREDCAAIGAPAALNDPDGGGDPHPAADVIAAPLHQVAPAGQATSWGPLTAALLALSTAAGGLGVLALRRRPGRRPGTSSGSA